jgi:hypothetical protein
VQRPARSASPGFGIKAKRLDEALALDKVEELAADRAVVQSLPLGSFIAWNRLTRSGLDGRVS